MTMFTDVPLNGYQKGDIWHYKEGQDWSGRNLAIGTSLPYTYTRKETSGTDVMYSTNYTYPQNLGLKDFLNKYFTLGDSLYVSVEFDFFTNDGRPFDLDDFDSTFFINAFRIRGGSWKPAGNANKASLQSSSDLSKVQAYGSILLNNADFTTSDNSETYKKIAGQVRLFPGGYSATYKKLYLTNGDTATPWQPAPEDLLPNGATEGYFIAGRDSESFDFNDWAYYSQPIQNFSKLLWFAESIEI